MLGAGKHLLLELHQALKTAKPNAYAAAGVHLQKRFGALGDRRTSGVQVVGEALTAVIVERSVDEAKRRKSCATKAVSEWVATQPELLDRVCMPVEAYVDYLGLNFNTDGSVCDAEDQRCLSRRRTGVGEGGLQRGAPRPPDRVVDEQYRVAPPG